MRTRSSLPLRPRPTLPLSLLPSEDLRALTQPVSNSPTRGLGLTERATLRLRLGLLPSQSQIDTDLLARAAWKLHELLHAHGLHGWGGHMLARELEYWYSPWGVRPTRDADRGWQLLAAIDASPVTGIDVWLEADPLTPYGDRRHMRLHERVAELAARR